MPPPRPETPQPQEGIAVEILSTGQFGRLNSTPRLRSDSPARDDAGDKLPAQPGGLVAGTAQAPPAMIRATTFLSARSLANPRSRQARLALLKLADEDRMEQLCAVEAMDQIHAWRDDLRPERLIAFAMAETKTSGHTMQADGGAFRSGGQWYNLRFRCEVTPDHEQVVSFEFLVGDPVPREEWDRRNLPAVH